MAITVMICAIILMASEVTTAQLVDYAGDVYQVSQYGFSNSVSDLGNPFGFEFPSAVSAPAAYQMSIAMSCYCHTVLGGSAQSTPTCSISDSNTNAVYMQLSLICAEAMNALVSNTISLTVSGSATTGNGGTYLLPAWVANFQPNNGGYSGPCTCDFSLALQNAPFIWPTVVTTQYAPVMMANYFSSPYPADAVFNANVTNPTVPLEFPTTLNVNVTNPTIPFQLPATLDVNVVNPIIVNTTTPIAIYYAGTTYSSAPAYPHAGNVPVAVADIGSLDVHVTNEALAVTTTSDSTITVLAGSEVYVTGSVTLPVSIASPIPVYQTTAVEVLVINTPNNTIPVGIYPGPSFVFPNQTNITDSLLSSYVTYPWECNGTTVTGNLYHTNLADYPIYSPTSYTPFTCAASYYRSLYNSELTKYPANMAFLGYGQWTIYATYRYYYPGQAFNDNNFNTPFYLEPPPLVCSYTPWAYAQETSLAGEISFTMEVLRSGFAPSVQTGSSQSFTPNTYEPLFGYMYLIQCQPANIIAGSYANIVFHFVPILPPPVVVVEVVNNVTISNQTVIPGTKPEVSALFRGVDGPVPPRWRAVNQVRSGRKQP